MEFAKLVANQGFEMIGHVSGVERKWWDHTNRIGHELVMSTNGDWSFPLKI